jgi:hypothetical protein
MRQVANDAYRVKAAEFSAKARNETNATLKAECERRALGYLHLADLADRNSRIDKPRRNPARRRTGSRLTMSID